MAVGLNVVGDVARKLVVSVLCHVQSVVKEGLAGAVIHCIEVHGTSLKVGGGSEEAGGWAGRRAGRRAGITA